MTCNLEAKPEPKLTWFRDNTEITNGGRYIVALKKDASGADRYVASLTVKVQSKRSIFITKYPYG